MMTTKLKLIIIAVLVIGMLAIANMVRKKSIELKYALSWFIVAILLLIVTVVPGLLEGIASLLGIYSSVNMIFFMGFCFLLAIVFSLSVALSRCSKRIRNLTQQVGLNEKRLNELYNAINDNQEDNK